MSVQLKKNILRIFIFNTNTEPSPNVKANLLEPVQKSWVLFQENFDIFFYLKIAAETESTGIKNFRSLAYTHTSSPCFALLLSFAYCLRTHPLARYSRTPLCTTYPHTHTHKHLHADDESLPIIFLHVHSHLYTPPFIHTPLYTPL